MVAPLVATLVSGAVGARAQTPTNSPKADDRKRIWVRGCPVDSDCKRQAAGQMREFEVKLGRESLRRSPWLKSTRARLTATSKPSSVDPKLAWLDNINKPDLPIRWTPELLAYLDFYKNTRRGRNIMGHWLTIQNRYEAMIVSTLRKAKLPEDLLYICMIESSYNPHTYSRAGASGLWQFMPSGARIYGLQRNHWIDERKDQLKSTKAVMMYFADLYHRFRNWHLAMAAYNQGYNGMLRSIAKYNTNDYWQLLRYENALPRDTALYVPKALAAAIIGRNRKLFGFDTLKLQTPLTWDEVMVPKSTALTTVAKAAGVSVKLVRQLNPQLLRGRTPPGVRNYSVRIPRGSGTRFSRYYDQYRSEWDRYVEYKVSHGERLADIAASHGTSLRRLKRLNHIKHRALLGGGSILLVPRVTAAMKRVYTDRAKRRRRRNKRRAGNEAVLVAVPDKHLEMPGKRRVFYRVVKGDSLRGVARAFRVLPTQLVVWNKLNAKGHLYPRMVLQVYVDPSFSLRRARIKAMERDQVMLVTRGSAEHLHMAELRNGRQRMVYRARGRESFKRIGKKFGLTARDLARINRRKPSTVLRAGDEIIVYRVVDGTRSRRATRQARRLRRHKDQIARKRAARRAAKRAAERAERRRAERAAAKREAKRAKRRRARRRTRKARVAERKRGTSAARKRGTASSRKRTASSRKRTASSRKRSATDRKRAKPTKRQARTKKRQRKRRRRLPTSIRRRR